MISILVSILALDFLQFENGQKTLTYTGYELQGFKLHAGKYKIESYGAQGGNGVCTLISDNKKGGKGAYSSGILTLTEPETILYAGIGQMGQPQIGGDNGGSGGSGVVNYAMGGGGGGATDLRIGSQELQDRIMVAAGGSGSIFNVEGEPGGMLEGFQTDHSKLTHEYHADYYYNFAYFTVSGEQEHIKSTKTTQKTGSADGWGELPDYRPYLYYYDIFGSGGGGGLFGGMCDIFTNDYYGLYYYICHSGSSYISGYNGCDDHYSGIKFDEPYMESGLNEGDGYMVITQIDPCQYCEMCESNVCKKCKDEYYLYNDLCINKCPEGYIGKDGQCVINKPTDTFSKSSMFSFSKAFTQSNPFKESALFSASNDFSKSSYFTYSNMFSNSKPFEQSDAFTQSSFFSSLIQLSDSVTDSSSSEDHSSSDIPNSSENFDDSSSFTDNISSDISISAENIDSSSSSEDQISLDSSSSSESNNDSSSFDDITSSGIPNSSNDDFFDSNYISDQSKDSSPAPVVSHQTFAPSFIPNSNIPVNSEIYSSDYSESIHALYSNSDAVNQKESLNKDKKKTQIWVIILITLTVILIVSIIIIILIIMKRKEHRTEEAAHEADSNTGSSNTQSDTIENLDFENPLYLDNSDPFLGNDEEDT